MEKTVDVISMREIIRSSRTTEAYEHLPKHALSVSDSSERDSVVDGKTVASPLPNSRRVSGVEGCPSVHPVRDKIHSRRSYVCVGILFFLNLINYMDRFTVAGVLTDIKDYYELGNSEAGLLQTIFVISYMVMAPVFGYLGDRYSRKLIIGCGVSFWSLTTFLGSFVPSGYIGVFMVLRAFVGTGEASYSTIAPTIIADLFFSSMRSKMLALFYFAIPVGSGLGYIVGSEVANLFGNWKWALRVTPVLGLLSVFLTFTTLHDPPRGQADGGSPLKNTNLKEDVQSLASNRSFMWSTGGVTCVAFAVGALAWWAPTYMTCAISVNGSNVDRNKVNFIFGVITCVAGITGVILGSASAQYYRRFSARADPIVCAFGVLGSVPLVFGGIVVAQKHTSISWALIFFGETFLCMNWPVVADMLLYCVIPTRRALAGALQILASHMFGDASSPYIIGAVSDAVMKGQSESNLLKFVSLQYALYITTFVLAIGGLCFIVTAWYIIEDREMCERLTHGESATPSMSSDDSGPAEGGEEPELSISVNDVRNLIV
ncbi:protein spinster homolog 1-like [Tachypleus tridentatus]|uniref:protein spinster homolog 1-like n=1 Tax=Tachypleus tridentatus TaxID=6853 RepID=UPI003FCF5F7B